MKSVGFGMNRNEQFCYYWFSTAAVGKFRVNVLSEDKSTALSVKSLRANPSPPSFLPSTLSVLLFDSDEVSTGYPHTLICVLI